MKPAPWFEAPRGTLLGLLVFAWLLGGAQPAHAQAVLYGCDNAGNLFTVNIATGAGSPVVCVLPTPVGSTEIECDQSATLWSQGRDGSFTSEGFTLACVSVSPSAVSGWSFNGLEFVGGVLYGTGIQGPCAPSTLHTLNPATGAVIGIGATGTGPISGLAYGAANQVMYGIAGCGSTGTTQLYTINLGTGAATPLGPVQSWTAGSLEFGPDGNLYAGGDTRDGGNIYRFAPPFNAGAVLVGASGYPNVTGLTLCGGITATGTTSWGRIKILHR